MSYYQSGTVSVATGSTAVSSQETVFLAQAAPGDLFISNGIVAVIKSIETSNALTLADGWVGPTLTDSPDYIIAHTGADWHSTVTVNEKISDLIERLTTGLGQIMAVQPDNKGTVTGGTTTFDATANSRFLITNGGAHAWALLWPSNRYSEIEIMVTNGGKFPITLPAGVRWLKGDGTTSQIFADTGVNLQAAGVNTFIFWTPDGGVTLYGIAG